MKTKRLLVLIFLGILFLSIPYQKALAADRVVVLTVPGCVWSHTANRVRSILKSIDGVMNVKTDIIAHSATVSFNDEKTGVEEMKKALRKGNFPVKGEPEFLE